VNLPQARDAGQAASTARRDANKLSTAAGSLKEASQCLGVTVEALAQLRNAEAELIALKQSSADAAAAVVTHKHAMDAARLALVVAEADAEGPEPSGAARPPNHLGLSASRVQDNLLHRWHCHTAATCLLYRMETQELYSQERHCTAVLRWRSTRMPGNCSWDSQKVCALLVAMIV
jgi:hypothetical protein